MTNLPKTASLLIKEMVRPYKGRVALFFLFSFFGILSWSASPFAIRELINELAKTGEVTTKAWVCVGVFVLLRFTDEWSWRIAENSMRKTQPPMVERIRSMLFGYTLTKSHTFFVNTSSGKLGHYINETTSTLNEVIQNTIWGVWPRVAALTLSGIFLVSAHWSLAVLFFVWIAFMLTLNMVRSKKFGALVKIKSESISDAGGLVVDALSNNLSVRVFNAQAREVNALHKQQDDIIKKWHKEWKYHIFTNAVQGNSIAVAGAAALVIILWLFGDKQIGVGDVVLFVAYFGDASSSIWELAWQLNLYYQNFGVINNALENINHGDPERTVAKTGDLPVKSSITMKNVTFSYPDQKEKLVLHNINLHIQEGERIGLVGHSGAGKTTFVSLLLNFYDITNGEFSIGGIPTAGLTPAQMRELIAYVPQDTSLFNRTIAANIAYANPRATNKQIEQAAKDAQAYEFIQKLPKGFDTVIGERGVKLSGGQRQRIAIARALLKNSPILLLDEATSALDSVSEHAIQKAFVTAMKNRTSIVVAHRLSTLRHLDRIIVFDNGTIAESGTHDELVAANGIYADLWRRQKDGFIGE